MKKKREIYERPFEPVKVSCTTSGCQLLLDFNEAKAGDYYIKVTKKGSKRKFINNTYVIGKEK